MMQEQTKTGLDLSTIKDNLPLFTIWRQVLVEVWGALSIVSVTIFIFFAFMLGYVGLMLGASLTNSSPWPVAILFAVVFFSLFGMGLFMNVAKKMRVLLRASACAQANGFQIIKGLKNPNYPGIVFSLGDTRNALSIIEGNYKKHEFKIFNYSYMTGSGKNRSEHKKGIVMLKLPRKVPHVVFDSKANNLWGLNSLDMAFAKSQRFTFEGDFNKHFDVYAPQSYGRDVLYFMTPELMALLIDKAGKYDVEVVDDNLFFYAPEFDYKKNQLENIFQLIDTVGGEFSDNTQRYADERIGDKNINLISEQGRRLKRGVSWAVWVILIIYLMFTILNIMGT